MGNAVSRVGKAVGSVARGVGKVAMPMLRSVGKFVLQNPEQAMNYAQMGKRAIQSRRVGKG